MVSVLIDVDVAVILVVSICRLVGICLGGGRNFGIGFGIICSEPLILVVSAGIAVVVDVTFS